MQHIHLELLWVLINEITKQNKHNSRINISNNYKIVINSPEVYFGIKRQHAEVGHKNVIVFSYKNHLDKFFINIKQFI
jgi:predicted NUDIX family NTP pyrophosphohydrolase